MRDFITFGKGIGDEQEILQECACDVEAIKPSPVDATDASIDATHTMKVTLRYSERLDPVLAEPANYWFKLARHFYTSQGVLRISRSHDRRSVVVLA